MPTLRSRIAAVPLARQAYRGLRKCARGSGVPSIWRAFDRAAARHPHVPSHARAGLPADPFDTCPSVSAGNFRDILRYVSERFTPVSLRDLCNGRLRKTPAAAITFDNGWRDNYEVAFPILREFGVPATIFVTTGKIGSGEPFWQQRLGQVFRAAIAKPDGEAARGLRSVLDVRDSQALTPELYREMVLRWKRHKEPELMDLLRALGCPGPSGSDRAHQFLDPAEIREMAAGGIDFGSHTVSHAILPLHSRPDVQRELSDSKAAVEALLGGIVDTFAYPDGRYSREVVACVRRTGYRIACTAHPSRISVARTLCGCHGSTCHGTTLTAACHLAPKPLNGK